VPGGIGLGVACVEKFAKRIRIEFRFGHGWLQGESKVKRRYFSSLERWRRARGVDILENRAITTITDRVEEVCSIRARYR
jgi:hypothetical protein